VISEVIQVGYGFHHGPELQARFKVISVIPGRTLSIDGFRKSRGSSYANRSGLVVKVLYDRRGGTASWAVTANR
jgi:hypothetical protein